MRLPPHRLTYLAEDLGRRTPAPIRWLLLLSRHPSEVVREGAIYGLTPHREHPDVRERLALMGSEDANECVRRAASEALEP